MYHSIFGMFIKIKWYLFALYFVNFLIFWGIIEDMGVFIDTPSILFVLVVSAIYASISAKDRSNFLPNFCSAALVAGLIGTIIGLIGIPDAGDRVFVRKTVKSKTCQPEKIAHKAITATKRRANRP